MRSVIQRVTRATVSVDATVVGEIGPGLLVLVGVADGDGPADIEYTASKIRDLRIFGDDQGRMKVPLEHEDAPVLRRYTAAEFRDVLGAFSSVELRTERFPVKSRLHKGWKGAVYNGLFVGTFNALPQSWVQPYGWHLLAFCRK